MRKDMKKDRLIITIIGVAISLIIIRSGMFLYELCRNTSKPAAELKQSEQIPAKKEIEIVSQPEAAPAVESPKTEQTVKAVVTKPKKPKSLRMVQVNRKIRSLSAKNETSTPNYYQQMPAKYVSSSVSSNQEGVVQDAAIPTDPGKSDSKATRRYQARPADAGPVWTGSGSLSKQHKTQISAVVANDTGPMSLPQATELGSDSSQAKAIIESLDKRLQLQDSMAETDINPAASKVSQSDEVLKSLLEQMQKQQTTKTMSFRYPNITQIKKTKETSTLQLQK